MSITTFKKLSVAFRINFFYCSFIHLGNQIRDCVKETSYDQLLLYYKNSSYFFHSEKTHPVLVHIDFTNKLEREQ